MVSKEKIAGIILFFCLLFTIDTVVAQRNKTFSIRATYYNDKFENRKTSSGEVFSQKLYTAAHRTLPLQTVVKVTSNRTGKSVLVKINDRCGRHGIIDVSKSAAQRIGLTGSEQVVVTMLGKEYIDIWKQQDLIFQYSDLSSQEQENYIDSLVVAKQNNLLGIYYVRLITVEGKEAMKNIVDSIPDKYHNMVQTEKVYNENFYYINIGPFHTEEMAGYAINELKKKYPLAHLVKSDKK